jgi:hypothetical protein
MANRETIIAAQDAWRAAEKAYGRRGLQVRRGMVDCRRTSPTVPEPVSYEVLDKLTQLRAAADSARAAYRDVLGET